MTEENERFTEPLQVRITPSQAADLTRAETMTKMKRPEVVRQALRRGIPLLLEALGVEQRPTSHGAEEMPIPSEV